MACWRRWEGDSSLAEAFLRWKRGLLDGVGCCFLGLGSRKPRLVVLADRGGGGTGTAGWLVTVLSPSTAVVGSCCVVRRW